MAGFEHVIDIGEGQPLVLLHGWSVDAALFAAQHELAHQGFRIIIPDLPGHGQDSRRGADLTIASLADVLRDHLQHHGIRDAVLVGWSMGATVALDHLARHGTEGIAQGLAIVDMTAKVPNDAAWSHGLRSGQTLADTLAAAERMETGWSRYAPKIAEALFAPGYDRDTEAYRRTASAIEANDPVTMAALWRSLVTADHRETLASLPIPVLALAGAESQLYAQAVAGWIAENGRAASATVIAGAGHSPHVENPSAFNAALAQFAGALD